MQRAIGSTIRSAALGHRLPALARTAGLAPACRRAMVSSHFQAATRTLHWTASRHSSPLSSPSSYQPSPEASTDSPALAAPSSTPSPPPETFKLEPRMSITFTCTADACDHRSSHEFTKRSYTKGIVIVQCPGCKSRHLIADHLGWFKEVTAEGQQRTIEDIMRAKGETVRRGHIDSSGGTVEYAPK